MLGLCLGKLTTLFMAVVPHALTTLANLKSYLGITDSSNDVLLEKLIDNVTEWIEGQLGGRRIKETQYTDDRYDGGTQDIFLRQWPITELTSVQFNTGTISAPVWQSFAADDFVKYAEQGIIRFIAGTGRPGLKNLRFTFKAGFTAIPDDLELVAKQLIADVFNSRLAGGKKAESVEGASITWAGAGGGESELSAEQKAVLQRYARFNAVGTQV